MVKVTDSVSLISTNNVYNILRTRDSCDSRDLCESTLRLSLDNRTESGRAGCKFGFFCNFGKGDPCADFGIAITGETVCHEGEVVSGELAAAGNLELDIWDALHSSVMSSATFHC